jgi:hypothetical protein
MKLLHETDVRAETHRTKVRESLDRIHRDLLSAYEVLARQVYPDAHGKNALGMTEEEAAAALGEHADDVRDIVSAVEALLDQLKPGSAEKGRGHRKDGTAAAGKLIPLLPHTASDQAVLQVNETGESVPMEFNKLAESNSQAAEELMKGRNASDTRPQLPPA